MPGFLHFYAEYGIFGNVAKGGKALLPRVAVVVAVRRTHFPSSFFFSFSLHARKFLFASSSDDGAKRRRGEGVCRRREKKKAFSYSHSRVVAESENTGEGNITTSPRINAKSSKEANAKETHTHIEGQVTVSGISPEEVRTF